MDVKKMLDEFILVFLNKLTYIGLDGSVSTMGLVVNTIPYCRIVVTDYGGTFEIIFKYNDTNKRQYYICSTVNCYRNGLHMIDLDYYRNNVDYINDIIIDDLIRNLLHYKNVKLHDDLSKQHSLIFNNLEFHIRKIKLGQIDELWS